MTRMDSNVKSTLTTRMRSWLAEQGAKGGAASKGRYQWDAEAAQRAARKRWREEKQEKATALSAESMKRAAKQGMVKRPVPATAKRKP